MRDHNERWPVPADFPGATCYVICGGASVKKLRHLIPFLDGPCIAVKQSALLRPDAEIMLIAAHDDNTLCADALKQFTGRYLVSRKIFGWLPERTKIVGRTKGPFSDDPRFVGGLDTGTSAINMAFHYIGGRGEIVVLGYDMMGGRWLNGEIPHPMPFPPQVHFDRHLECGAEMAKEIAKRGVKVWNTSLQSKATFYEYRGLKAFL